RGGRFLPPHGADDEEAGGVSEERRMTPLRSLLFVPGDSARKQEKALATDADALILDLEDSVDPANLPAARARVAELLRSQAGGCGPQLWVRVNAPASGLLREDLEGVCAERLPAGIVLPKISAPGEIVEAAAYVTALETRRGVAGGATRLLVVATETPQGLLALPQYPAVLHAARAAAAPRRPRRDRGGAGGRGAGFGGSARRGGRGGTGGGAFLGRGGPECGAGGSRQARWRRRPHFHLSTGAHHLPAHRRGTRCSG